MAGERWNALEPTFTAAQKKARIAPRLFIQWLQTK
jgi:hypothetical protein